MLVWCVLLVVQQVDSGAPPRKAYDDSATEALVALARAAQHGDDIRLRGYDATVVQRLTVGLAVTRLGRARVLFRQETAARVRWQRGDSGAGRAVVDVTGDRTAVPLVPGATDDDVDETRDVPLPYVPGRPVPWSWLRSGTLDPNSWIDPLATGAEAYYRYSRGDSITVRTLGAPPIHLREIRLHPRRPMWNLSVGSLWVDESSGHLVRAVYRLAAPIDIIAVAKASDPHAFDDVPFYVRPLLMPMTAHVDVMTIEYALLDGRFWLPVSGRFEGAGQASFMRVPFQMEARYRYASINVDDSLPAVNTAERDSSGRRGQCAAANSWSRVDTAGTVAVLVRTPCDTMALARSATLPPLKDELLPPLTAVETGALGLGAQPDWAPRPIALHYGLQHELIRYNRIEGLSVGAAASDELGAGYTVWGEARIGTADVSPNGELRVTRADGATTIGAAVYRRLVSANDWGDPFSAGSSIWALIVGDDEGFYFRSWGAELTARTGEASGAPVSWRLFGERETTARVQNEFSLFHALGGPRFRPNLIARDGEIGGVAVDARPSVGDALDLYGWQIESDLRGEGGAGSFAYARGAGDVTVAHGLTPFAAGALTAGAGMSAGDVPAQRFWYLGGLRTVRGVQPGTEAGDAYWMTRAELGPRIAVARPVVFYDLGWAGNRADWGHQGRAISGAGVGASFFAGLVRLDVARGIYPTNGWRTNAYLGATF